MFKIMKEEAPSYLLNLVPKCEKNRIRKNKLDMPTFNC